MAEVVVTRNNFEEVVMKSEKTVLLDFWASWCGPCMMIAPIIEEIANEYPQYLVGKINVDEEGELAGAFGVTSIPTLVVMKGGETVKQAAGARPKAAILAMLEA